MKLVKWFSAPRVHCSSMDMGGHGNTHVGDSEFFLPAREKISIFLLPLQLFHWSNSCTKRPTQIQLTNSLPGLTSSSEISLLGLKRER